MTAALRAGLWHPPLGMLVGFLLLGGALSVHLLAGRAAPWFTNALRTALDGRGDPAAAVVDALFVLLLGILPAAVAMFAAFLVTAWFLRGKGGSGRTAVPLPTRIPRLRYVVPAGIACAALCAVAAVAIFLRGGFAFATWVDHPQDALSHLLGVISRFLAAAGAIALTGGLVQVALYRRKMRAELSLHRAQAQAEQRLQGGGGRRGR